MVKKTPEWKKESNRRREAESRKRAERECYVLEVELKGSLRWMGEEQPLCFTSLERKKEAVEGSRLSLRAVAKTDAGREEEARERERATPVSTFCLLDLRGDERALKPARATRGG